MRKYDLFRYVTLISMGSAVISVLMGDFILVVFFILLTLVMMMILLMAVILE